MADPKDQQPPSSDLDILDEIAELEQMMPPSESSALSPDGTPEPIGDADDEPDPEFDALLALDFGGGESRPTAARPAESDAVDEVVIDIPDADGVPPHAPTPVTGAEAGARVPEEFDPVAFLDSVPEQMAPVSEETERAPDDSRGDAEEMVLDLSGLDDGDTDELALAAAGEPDTLQGDEDGPTIIMAGEQRPEIVQAEVQPFDGEGATIIDPPAAERPLRPTRLAVPHAPPPLPPEATGKHTLPGPETASSPSAPGPVAGDGEMDPLAGIEDADAPLPAVDAPKMAEAPVIEPAPELPEERWARYVAELAREARLREGVESGAISYEAAAVAEEKLDDASSAAGQARKAMTSAPGLLPVLGEAVRRYLAAGNAPGAMKALETAASSEPDSVRRAMLHCARGHIAEVVLKDTEAAAAAYDAAIEAAPKEHWPLLARERLALAAGDSEQLLELWKLLGVAVKTPERKALYLHNFATANEAAGREPDLTLAALNQAYFSDPQDPELLDHIRGVARRHGRWGDVIAALAKEAQALEAMEDRPEEVADLHRRMAEIYLDKLGESESGWTSLELALEFGPGHPGVLGTIIRRAHEDPSRRDMGRRAWHALAGATSDASDRASLWHALAMSLLAHGGSGSSAKVTVQALQSALQADPGHLPSLQTLSLLLLRERNYGALADILDDIVLPPETEPDAVAAHCSRIAALRELAGDGERADATYVAALAASPGYIPAVMARAALLRQRGELDGLRTHLERCLDPVAAPARPLLQEELLHLLLLRDDANDEAREVLVELRHGDPERPGALMLEAELQERSGAFDKAAALLDAIAARTDHGPTRAAAVLRSARLHEEQLVNVDGAVQRYERAAAATPASPLAVSLLERALPHDQKERAAAAWERLAQATDDPELAAAARLREAELADAKGQREQAITAYEAVLSGNPVNVTALRALSRLRRESGDLAAAAVLKEREAAAYSAGASRGLASLEAAQLFADVGTPEAMENAKASTEEAALAGGGAVASELLLRFSANAADWDAFTLTADTMPPEEDSDPARAVGVNLTIALAQELALNNLELAEKHYRAALEVDSEDRVALRGLARVSSARGQDAAALEMLSRRAALQSDPSAQAQLHLLHAELQRIGGGDPMTSYEAALAVQPEHPEALRELARRKRMKGDAEGALPLLQRLLEHSPADQRGNVLADIAEVLEELGRLGEALERYRGAAVAGADALGMLLAQRRVARRAGDAEAVAAACQALAELSEQPQHVASFSREAAVELERVGKNEEAEAALRLALAAEPGHRDTFLELRRLLHMRGDEAARAALLAQQLEHTDGATERSALLVELAELQVRVEKRRDEAISNLRRALEEEPHNLMALELLPDLLVEAGSHAEAVEHYQAYLGLGTDQELRRIAQLKLGETHARHLKDADSAIAAFSAVLETNPKDVDALRRLVALYSARGRAGDAASALEILAPLIDHPQERCGLLEQLAELYERLGDADRAAERYADAYRVAPLQASGGARLARLWAGRRAAVSEVLAGTVAALRAELQRAPYDLALMRQLADVAGWRRQVDEAACFAELLDTLGAASSEQSHLAGTLRQRRTSPKRALGDLRSRFIPEAARSPLRQLLVEMAETVRGATTQRLANLGVTKKDRDHPKHRSPLRQELEELADVVGSGALNPDQFEVYRAQVPADGVLGAIVEGKPTILVGVDATDADGLLPVARHQAARVLAAAAGGWLGLLDAPSARLAAACAALVRLGAPEFKPDLMMDDVETAISKASNRKLRKTMAQRASAFTGAWPRDFDAFHLAMHADVRQVAFAVTGQLRASLSALIGGLDGLGNTPEARLATLRDRPQASALIDFSISENYFELRTLLGVALEGD